AGCVPNHGESGAARSATTAALRRGSRASTAQESHHRLGVTVSRGGSPGGQLLEPPQVIVGQGHVEAFRFSRRYVRRLVPKIGTTSLPRASTQASASCAGVQPNSCASSATHPTRSRFRWKFSPWKRGECRR